MNSQQIMAVYGLMWNPFLPGAPVEGLYVTPRSEAFARRCETYLGEGGFAMVTGAVGASKSTTLRLVDSRLARVRDVAVRAITHPQSKLNDWVEIQ